jgi:hypothetical protein
MPSYIRAGNMSAAFDPVGRRSSDLTETTMIRVRTDAESLNGIRGIIVGALAAIVAFWLPILLALVHWVRAG